MSAQLLDRIIRDAQDLSPQEQLKLAAHLLEQASQALSNQAPRRKWSEIAGLAPYPLAGEDAQAWVSRTRSEADDMRARQWRHSP